MIRGFFESPLRVISVLATLLAIVAWTWFESTHRAATRENLEMVISLCLFALSFSLPLWIGNAYGNEKIWAWAITSGWLWAIVFSWVGLFRIPFSLVIE
jgi:hypothetical protein